jgi:hypothetical protein
MGRRTGRQTVVVLYVLALVAVVVGVDVLFFRHQLWERLMVNVGVVLVFAAFYLSVHDRSRLTASAIGGRVNGRTPAGEGSVQPAG